MATLQLKLKQVNFDASDYPEYESELEDPISNVVDANTDFLVANEHVSLRNSFTPNQDLDSRDLDSGVVNSRKNSIERDKFNGFDLPQVHEKSSQRVLSASNGSCCRDPSYPGISADVARCIYEMNPDVISTVEAALKPDSKKAAEINVVKSNLTCLRDTSETFALQQSNIGNRMTPTSPEPAKTPTHLPPPPTNNHNHNTPQTPPNDPTHKILHKFPPDRITTITERKPSWFLTETPQTPPDPPIPPIHKPPIPTRRTTPSTPPTPRHNPEIAPKNDPRPNHTPKSDQSDARSIGSTESAYSDKYELDSNYSDLLETQSLASNMSDMSSVSGIEEEMYRIKKLLLEVPALPDDHPDFHKRSVVFGRNGGVVVSDDCLEPDRFVVSQEVFFELQREKANLEGQIETLRAQFDDLTVEKRALGDQLTAAHTQVAVQTSECRKERCEREKMASKLQFMQKMNKTSDGSNAQLAMSLDAKATDLAQVKEEVRDLEECNARLRVDGEELRMELETKEGAVRGLKAKIGELHVEAQLATQAKIQAVNEQLLVKSEMDALQKSREWYREQLHALQESRNKMQQEILTLQGCVVAGRNETEKQRNENAQLRVVLTETQQRAVKEKETLMRHLESIQADMVAREASLLADKGVAEASLVTRTRVVEEETSGGRVEDLEEEIRRFKAEISTKNESFRQLEASYVEAMRRLTVAEKSVCERDLEVQRKAGACGVLEGRVGELEMRLESKDAQVGALRDAKTATEIALAAAEKEKRDVDEALSVVRENLVKLNANFRKIKTDLVSRDASVEQLLKERSKMESTVAAANQKIIALKSSYEGYASELKSRDGIIGKLEENRSELDGKLTESREKRTELEGVVARVREEKEMVVRRCADLENEVSRVKIELKSIKIDKNETEIELEKILKSIPGEKSDENVEKRVRRNSQDLSDGTKILDDPCDEGCVESYPRDELEREVLLMRQALDTREKQVEKYLKERNEMQNAMEALRRANSGVRRGNAEVETQTDNVSFMKHVLEMDGRNSVTQGRFEGLEAEYKERQRVYDSNIRVLTRKLKEVMKAHKKAETELKNWRVAVARNRSDSEKQGERVEVITALDLGVGQKSERNLKREILHYRAKVKGLQMKLKESQTNYDDMKSQVEANKEAMLDLERERGKLTGVNRSNEALKSHAQRLESALAEKDVTVTELDIAKQDLTTKREEEEQRNKQWIEELEINLTAERETAKELRKQVFNAKRESSSLRKHVSSLRTGLDNANQLMEMKKKEIDLLIDKLALKSEAEIRLMNQYECLGADHRRNLSEIERLKQQAIENQTKDGLLAEQLKNLSWHLRQKNQELTALKDQLKLVEERHKTTSDALHKSLQTARTETQCLKSELENTRKDKYNSQNAISELKNALKTSFEANKALHAQTRHVPDDVLDLPILESPVPYDETLINSLLQQSAFIPHSRPLSDLQSCLNTLKEEMAILQEQLSEQD